MVGSGKFISGLVITLTCIVLFFPGGSYAQKFNDLEIYPEQAGIFVTTGKQQFVAFGITETGDKVNITHQVNWESSDTGLVRIDKDGLAVLQPGVSYGQVNISCSSREPKMVASTSLTIVKVAGSTFNGKRTSVDVTRWPGSWPTIPDRPDQSHRITFPDEIKGGQFWYEVYLFDVTINSINQRWKTIPYAIPWRGFSEAGGLNSLIANVFSYDGGESFWVHSWDYLVPGAHVKGGPGGTWDDCWVGLMVHSFCDFTDADCNGRYRSNVYFTAINNDSDCWGINIKKEK